MAEYGKKLHVIKNGVEEEITLYDDKSEASENALCLLDGATPIYAALGDVTDSEASSLRVRYNGQTYSVLKEVASGGPLGLRLAAEGGGYGTWEYVTPDMLKRFDPVLNNNSWEQISLAARLGIADWIWNVGDVKMIELNGRIGNFFTADHLELGVFILDINHPMYDEASGTMKPENNIIFGGFKSALTGGLDVALCDSKYTGSRDDELPGDGSICFNMNHTAVNGFGTNYGGWKGSDLRYDILGATSTPPSMYNQAKNYSNVGYDATESTLTNPKADTFLAALPSDLRKKLRLWTRWLGETKGSSGTDADIKPSVDAVTLLSKYEVSDYIDGNTNTYEKNYNTRMAYYDNGSSYKRHYVYNSTLVFWRVCSASGQSTSNRGFCFNQKNNSSTENMEDSRFVLGLAPAFKI